MESLGGGIIILVCCLICGITFLSIGLHARKAEGPVHFWSGQVLKTLDVTDVKAYNRACSRMWMVYSLCYFAAGAVWLVWLQAGTLLMAASAMPGVFVLMMAYGRVEKKYRIGQ